MPAPLLFILSGLTQYLGAALAVGIFGTVAAATVAWLRIAVAAVVLVLWRRPWRSRFTRQDLRTAVVFGVVLGVMNVAFYIAIDHLPLGTAVSIEFLGPVSRLTPASRTTPIPAIAMPTRSRQPRPVKAATATGPRNSIDTAVPRGRWSMAM